MDQEINSKMNELVELCKEKEADVVVSVFDVSGEDETLVYTDTPGLMKCLKAIELASMKYADKQMERIAKKRLKKKSDSNQRHIHIAEIRSQEDFEAVLDQIFGGGNRDDD